MSSAIDNLDLDQEIYDVVSPMLTVTESNIALVTDALENDISTIDSRVLQNTSVLEDLQAQAQEFALASTTEMLAGRIAVLETTASTATMAIEDLQGQVTALEATASSTLALVQSLLDDIGDNNDEISVIDNPDLDIQTLVVNQAATFYGTITVIGEVGFESKVVFKKEVEFQDHITVDKDTAGTAIIPAQATSTEVVFESEYEVVPKIAANLKGDADNPIFVDWLIANQSVQGFRIVISETQDTDLTFDWIALAVKDNNELGTENNEPEPVNESPVVEKIEVTPAEIEALEWAELWVEAFDPENEELSYLWTANLGKVEYQDRALTYYQAPETLVEPLEDELTLVISDGENEISRTLTLVINPPQEQQQEEEETEEEEPAVVRGCTDELALNYNPEANEDDGSCEYPITGCLDPEADNYNPEATEDDGSCEYPEPLVEGGEETEGENEEEVAVEPVDDLPGEAGGVGGPEVGASITQ